MTEFLIFFLYFHVYMCRPKVYDRILSVLRYDFLSSITVMSLILFLPASPSSLSLSFFKKGVLCVALAALEQLCLALIVEY